MPARCAVLTQPDTKHPQQVPVYKKQACNSVFALLTYNALVVVVAVRVKILAADLLGLARPRARVPAVSITAIRGCAVVGVDGLKSAAGLGVASSGSNCSSFLLQSTGLDCRASAVEAVCKSSAACATPRN